MTRSEELYSAYVWFKNLFMPTLRGRPACKPTMPMVIPIIRSELAQVIGPISSATDFTFVDLGCGQGVMLRPMSEATIDGKPMFEGCVGVELDPNTATEAVAAVKDDPRCKVECGDMFGFVDRVCAGKRLFGGRAAFYIYEPLWMANLPEAEMDRLYAGLAAQVAKHPGSMIVYCSADSYRELKASVLEASGLVLQRSVPVAQNGVFNRLRGKFNTLEDSKDLTLSMLKARVAHFGERLIDRPSPVYNATLLMEVCRARGAREQTLIALAEHLVLKLGADPSARPHAHAVTPLIIAAARGLPKLAAFLLACGADPRPRGEGRFRLCGQRATVSGILCARGFVRRLYLAEEQSGVLRDEPV
ncbi:hypothetical protein Ctob_005583 [Chrysochromulina tobinii]|uniref:Uncharacterized protein n=1 Tax=Chrysochromulina tobinii TaxID=1460289 RepID=A0A0M0JR48_9EUKA|nr:hypothetical protein Ctob_005583 [Chrysochromulina tobinii]|eukprot:KOO28733.1 hypothetical protein Ctob_005583 [Chrysochromulina sp. CCMP291]